MSGRERGMSPAVFVPLLLVGLTVLVQVFGENAELRRQRDNLDTQWASQRETLENAQKLRAQLESIAGATASLAEQGNQNAILIRDQLAAQGITIRPPGSNAAN